MCGTTRFTALTLHRKSGTQQRVTCSLFDILADPCEHTNLAAEPSMQSVVAKMTKRLHEYAATAVTLTWCLNEGNEACTLPDGTMRDSDPSLFNGTWSPWCP